MELAGRREVGFEGVASDEAFVVDARPGGVHEFAVLMVVLVLVLGVSWSVWGCGEKTDGRGGRSVDWLAGRTEGGGLITFPLSHSLTSRRIRNRKSWIRGTSAGGGISSPATTLLGPPSPLFRMRRLWPPPKSAAGPMVRRKRPVVACWDGGDRVDECWLGWLTGGACRDRRARHTYSARRPCERARECGGEDARPLREEQRAACVWRSDVGRRGG